MVMELKQMLEEALVRIDTMTVEEFEGQCIKAGISNLKRKELSIKVDLTNEDVEHE